MAAQQGQQLNLSRCPHCSIARPRLDIQWETDTQTHAGGRLRHWAVYSCSSCGGLILTAGRGNSRNYVDEMYPEQRAINEAVPERARAYLTQAVESLHTPAGAIMLTGSAVDAMFKAKGYKEGSLYTRIDQAALDRLITDEMAAWAHDVRLDANDERHADETMALPTQEDAERVLEFALALAEFIFVLPERIKRGRKMVKTEPAVTEH